MREDALGSVGARIVTTTSNPHLGSSLDDLLDADGALAEAEAVAVKLVRAWEANQTATGQSTAAEDGVLKLEVVFESDEDGWVVASCPTLPGCHSQGRTRGEALTNIREAVEGYLASIGTCGDAAGAAYRLEPVRGPE